MKQDFNNKKVAILGYGINNAELVPFLLKRGAEVTICDKNESLPSPPPHVELRLGESYLENLQDFDIIFRTPGLPYLAPEIQAAKIGGVVITSQTQLFLEECRAKTIGVTGTKGKGTTASFITAILKSAQERENIKGNVYLAGNIGASAIDLFDIVTEDDWVILELSSFQLQDMTISPHIAVVLSITSDHLNHHKSVEEYHQAKSSIIKYQTEKDYAVFNWDSAVSKSFAPLTKAKTYYYGEDPDAELTYGAFVSGDNIILRLSGQDDIAVCRIHDIKLLGHHNYENAAAATIAAHFVGADIESIHEGLTAFSGLPHRLEKVAEKNGVSYYDDSIATVPDAAIAAIKAFDIPITIILGGSSKGADYQELVTIVSKNNVKHVIYMGEEGEKIKRLIEESNTPITAIDGGATMQEIVAHAANVTSPGGVVLLSPAAASFGMFKNYADRGDQFKAAARALSENKDETLKKQFHWLHFIGIKGVGMSALAIVAQGMGYKVTGSDVEEEFITDTSLRDAGIIPQEGFVASHITPDIDLVILGAAFGNDNPEVAQATTLNLPCWTYSELLGYLSRDQKTLAVAGTHGKTTTTSLLTYLLYKSGLSPSWVIGTGHVSGLPSHGLAGRGDYFVTEADDYKRANNDPTPKFLDLSPWGAIITSIEHDHPDLYPTLADCIEAFRKFISRVNEKGFIVVNGDDPNIKQLIAEFPDRIFITFGFQSEVEYHINPLQRKDDQNTWFTLEHSDKSYGPFILPLPGWHNLFNAAAAIVTALRSGVTESSIKDILPTFENVERRFQIIGTANNQIVIDDYAHHPTSVRLTLEAARQQYPKRPIWCFFQPHTYSRTKTLLKEFGTAFGDADMVVVTDIFSSAREKEVTITADVLRAETAKHHPHVDYVPFTELLGYMKKHVPDEAVVITMGAGDIYKVGREYLKVLQKQAQEARLMP